MNRAWELAGVAVLMLAVGMVYWSTLREGLGWSGDFSMYVMNAANLLEGRSYADTPYIYDPRITVGPSAYPPGLPALLTLPMSRFGLDIEALKRFSTLVNIIFLVVFYALARTRLRPGFALACTAVVAASPMLWDIKERILSDVPFLLWLAACAFASYRTGCHSQREPPWLGWGVTIGLLASACIATRTVGLILVPALLAHDLVTTRRIQRSTWVALGIIGLYWGIQAAWLGLEADYFRLAKTLLETGPKDANAASGLALGALPSRLAALPGDLSTFWTWANPGDRATIPVTAVVGLVALIGLALSWWRGPQLFDVFAPIYLAALLVLPSGLGTESRLYLPLQVALFLYIAVAAQALYERTQRHWLALVPALAIVALIGFSYQRSYLRLGADTFVYGPTTQASQSVFDFIRRHTPRDATFVFSKPRVLALYTGRPSRGLPDAPPEVSLRRQLEALSADYLLVHRRLDPQLHQDLLFSHPGLQVAMRNERFILWRVD